MQNALFTINDMRRARNLYINELIRPLTPERMFEGGLYCILTATENYSKQMEAYNRLFEHGMNSPEGIKTNPKKLEKILKKTRFHNERIKKVTKFAQWWVQSSLPNRIIEDIKNGREDEFRIREYLMKHAPGMGRKVGSLFLRMCGYHNVVPLDLWAVRFLEERGISVVANTHRKGEIGRKEYLEGERRLSEIARQHGHTPAGLQLLIYSKGSQWKPIEKSHQRAFDFYHHTTLEG